MDEFRSLLASAADLGIPHAPQMPCQSCNIVRRQMRFHLLEWGHRDAPAIVLPAWRASVGIRETSSACTWHRTLRGRQKTIDRGIDKTNRRRPGRRPTMASLVRATRPLSSYPAIAKLRSARRTPP
jgi:hypothetical protein